LETLLNILTTHGGRFQKFKFEFRSGISSNTCDLVFRKVKPTVDDAAAVRPRTRRSTRRPPSSPRCRSFTGASRTPVVDGGKALSLPPCHPTRGHARRPSPRSASDASAPAEEPRHPRPIPATQRYHQSHRARNFSLQTTFGNPSSRSLPSL
jgi:hypothetical protein